MAKGKADRQATRLRTLAVSHLNVATSHCEQAKMLIKNGHAQQAIDHMQKAIASIEGAHDAVPVADELQSEAELRMVLGGEPDSVGAAEPVATSADKS